MTASNVLVVRLLILCLIFMLYTFVLLFVFVVLESTYKVQYNSQMQ